MTLNESRPEEMKQAYRKIAEEYRAQANDPALGLRRCLTFYERRAQIARQYGHETDRTRYEAEAERMRREYGLE